MKDKFTQNDVYIYRERNGGDRILKCSFYDIGTFSLLFFFLEIH